MARSVKKENGLQIRVRAGRLSRDGDEFTYRVDGRNVEPGDGLHQNQPWLQTLLRRAACQPTAGYRTGELPYGFEVTLQPRMLELPLKWKSPKRIFVNSMSDLFHAEVPLPYIRDVFDIMRKAHWHQYQVLTKRSERLMELSKKLKWEPQIWMGVSVESEDYTVRIDHLRRTDAHVKFLSLEPLIGPLRKLDLRGIDWVIVGADGQ